MSLLIGNFVTRAPHKKIKCDLWNWLWWWYNSFPFLCQRCNDEIDPMPCAFFWKFLFYIRIRKPLETIFQNTALVYSLGKFSSLRNLQYWMQFSPHELISKTLDKCFHHIFVRYKESPWVGIKGRDTEMWNSLYGIHPLSLCRAER